MTKCELCNNTATRNLGRETDRPTHVCEIHYAEYKPNRARINPDNIDSCERCGTRGLSKDGRKQRLISHHVCYGHDTTVELCSSCHAKVHNDPDSELYPHDTKLTQGVADHPESNYPDECEYANILNDE